MRFLFSTLFFFPFLFYESLPCLKVSAIDFFFRLNKDEYKSPFYGCRERKTFVIAAYIVRSFLATQKESFIGLQINLCQLKKKIKELIKNVYAENRKKNYLEYQAFKSTLISTCIVYYILIYFSRYYVEEQEDEFIKTYIDDSFLYTFLYDTMFDLDFDSYDELSFDFRIRESGDQFLNLEYPLDMSFSLLGLLCSTIPDEFNANSKFCDTVHGLVRKLVNRVFTAHSAQRFMDITPEDLRDDNS